MPPSADPGTGASPMAPVDSDAACAERASERQAAGAGR
jgi:hypothetical protein